jgi:hypothetical protein
MGSTLTRSPLPRDASGEVDLTAVDRSLAALAGSTPPRRAEGVGPAALLARLSSLGAPSAPAKRNGHAPVAPELLPPSSPPPRETSGPAAPEAPAARPNTPTDVRGVGRVVVAPVSLADLAEKPSSTPASAATSDAPSVEAAAAPVEVAVPDEVDLGSLPPLDARSSELPPPMPPSPMPPPPSLPIIAAPAIATAPPLAPSLPAAPASAPASGFGARAPFPSLGGAPSRASYGSLPAVTPPRPSQAVAPEEVAAGGAVFDEFLGSAPVEPAARPLPPPSAPRAAPAIPTGPRRPPSMQMPAYRGPLPVAAKVPVAPRAAPPLVSDDEAIEPVEMEEMEVEEIVAPAPSKLPPLGVRPPAPPPLPPKKR